MKENALLTLFLLLLTFGSKTAFSQSTSTDKVFLKDGKVLQGKIVKYTPGQTLVLEQADGLKTELQDAEIAKVLQGLPQDELGEPNIGKAAIEPATVHGLYANSMLSFAAGSSGEEGLALGAGFSQVFGYQFGRKLGLGFGFGVDNYSRRGETVYPLFGEVRSFLPSKNNVGNFYLLAAGGFSLAFERKSLDITKAQGGPMGHAAFGYRATTTEGLDIFVDMGVKYQSAHFERSLFSGDLEVRDIDFKRIVVRVGIGLWK